jgi:hypothetical protein
MPDEGDYVHYLQELFRWLFFAGGVLCFSLGPSLVPSLIFSGLGMRNEETSKRLSYWKKVSIGMLGGVVGGITAIAVFFPAQSAWCTAESAKGSYCDGDGPMLLVALTIPVGSFVASSIAVLWTWFSFLIPADRHSASVFTYRGDLRGLNVGIALAVQSVYWSIFAVALYRLTLSELLH